MAGLILSLIKNHFRIYTLWVNKNRAFKTFKNAAFYTDISETVFTIVSGPSKNIVST
jgi:hypothetical protein